jgi:hypothetical protein
VGFARGEDEVVGEVLLVSGTPYAGRGLRPLAVARDSLLQNPPHPLDIIPRMPPIAQRVQFPMTMYSCLPKLISATARLILRVTKVRPRRGDSWLNRMPLLAKMA